MSRIAGISSGQRAWPLAMPWVIEALMKPPHRPVAPEPTVALSTTVTSWPSRAASNDAHSPVSPPPTTRRSTAVDSTGGRAGGGDRGGRARTAAAARRGDRSCSAPQPCARPAGDALDAVGGGDAVAGAHVDADFGDSRRSQRGVGEQLVDGADQLVVGERVGRQADPEAELVDPLGVVVLVPEQRQHDHRLAEVDALGGRVVAAVA